MRGDAATRALGAVLVAAAVPVLVWIPEPLGGAVAFGLGVTGAFVVVVVAQRVVPAAAAGGLVEGSAAALEHVRDGLRLRGRPVYVPDQGNVGAPRLFLPTQDDGRPVPILDASSAVHGGHGGAKTGVAVPAPGWVLAARHGDAAGGMPDGVGEAGPWLQGMLRGSDLARSCHVEAAGGGFDVRLRPGAAPPPCLGRAEEPHCETTGCALCQAVGCVLAQSLGRPLRVARAEVGPGVVDIRLEEAA